MGIYYLISEFEIMAKFQLFQIESFFFLKSRTMSFYINKYEYLNIFQV